MEGAGLLSRRLVPSDNEGHDGVLTGFTDEPLRVKRDSPRTLAKLIQLVAKSVPDLGLPGTGRQETQGMRRSIFNVVRAPGSTVRQSYGGPPRRRRSLNDDGRSTSP